jgi:hypothetical protein
MPEIDLAASCAWVKQPVRTTTLNTKTDFNFIGGSMPTSGESEDAAKCRISTS